MSNPINNNITISRKTAESLLAAPTSTVLTIGVVHPVDHMITLLQTGTSFKKALEKTLTKPYNAAEIALCKAGLRNCTLFLARPIYQHFAKKVSNSRSVQEFLSGTLAGVSSCFLTCPLSTLSVKKINCDKGRSAIDIYRDLPIGKKIISLYAGLMSNQLREGSFAGIYFSTLSFLTDQVRQLNAGREALDHEGKVDSNAIEPSKTTKVALGVFASLFAQLFSTPFDVVSKEQRNAEVAKSVYQTVNTIVSERSAWALWRGMPLAAPRMGLAGAALSGSMIIAESIMELMPGEKG